MIRIARQHAFATRERLVRAAEPFEHGRTVAKRIKSRGIGCNRVVERGKRFVEAIEFGKGAAALGHDRGDARPDRVRAIETVQRIGRAPHLAQHEAAVEPRFERVRIDHQRAVVGVERVVEAAERTQRPAAIAQRVEHERRHRQRAVERYERIVVTAQADQRVAAAHERLHVVGRRLQRGREMAERLVDAAALADDRTEIRQRAHVRRDRDRLAQQRFRVVGRAALELQHAVQVQRPRMIGRLREHREIVARRVVELSGAVPVLCAAQDRRRLPLPGRVVSRRARVCIMPVLDRHVRPLPVCRCRR